MTTDPSRRRIAFLGLGNMGRPMAANLVRAGFDVSGFDPIEKSLLVAADSGVVPAADIATAVAAADTVITMLPNGALVREAYDSALAAVGSGTLFIDCSTIEPTDARAAAERVDSKGCRAIDAPVSGGVVGAEAATLTFMAGGTKADLDRARPVLDAMGKKIVHCGETGAGQAAKICNNMILGISMIAVSEAFVLAEELGLSAQALYDVASTSSGSCWALNVNCPVPGPVATSPATRNFTGGFASALMLKDLHLSQAAATAAGVDTAMGRRATELYAALVAAQPEPRDFSSIIDAIRDRSTKGALR